MHFSCSSHQKNAEWLLRNRPVRPRQCPYVLILLSPMAKRGRLKPRMRRTYSVEIRPSILSSIDGNGEGLSPIDDLRKRLTNWDLNLTDKISLSSYQPNIDSEDLSP